MLDLRFFRMQAAVAQTWTVLKQHFTEANTNRKRQLTSEGAGFHGANSAVNSPVAAETNPTMAVVIAAAQAATNSANTAAAAITERSTTNAGPSATANAAAYGYCWSHDLSKNCQHTSATCNHPADGHKREATLYKMMGGNNTILCPQHEPAVFVANPPSYQRGTPAQDRPKPLVKSFALQTSDSTSSIVPTGSSPPTNKTVLADSAATGHFFPLQCSVD
jgi:hypothetical protein